jgi:hypothetical protein
MNESSAMGDGHMLEAISAELSAEVYETAVSDQAEPTRVDLDVGLPSAIAGTADEGVPEFLESAVQRNVEPDPS